MNKRSFMNKRMGVSRRGFLGGAVGTLGTVGVAPNLRAALQGDFQPQGITRALGPRWIRSFQAPDGTIYLLGSMKSTDGGRSVVMCDKSDPELGNEVMVRSTPSDSFELPYGFAHIISRRGLFLGFGFRVLPVDKGGAAAVGGLVEPAEGRCVTEMWRSFDNLKTIEKGETSVFLPEAGKILTTKWTPEDTAEKLAGWAGLFFWRGVVERSDGSLLMSMYGNFEQDRMRSTDPRSRGEGTYKMRCFVVRSTDQGKTWRYVSTIAAPRAGVVDDTEGPNEPWIEQLDDGRILAVMRTGHYTPMIASWSEDGGETWTEAVDMGLGPGVDACVLKLRDGRLAMAYGQLVQRSGPKTEDWRQEDQRRRCQLALNLDGTGESWVTTTVADFEPWGKAWTYRSAYPTIFEVEPGVIVYQCDADLWRVEL